MPNKRPSPYIWTTWLTGILAGDVSCEYSAWYRSHYQGYDKIPKDTNLTVWKAQHGEMLRARAKKLTDEGWSIFVEGQNKFAMHGRAATLGGVPDIVAIRESEAVVIDIKSGQRRDSDLFQILLYMLVLPLTHPFCAGKQLSGELQYRDGSLVLAPDRLTESVRSLIRTTIERVAGDVPLPRVPSFQDCRFCDIGSDCEERVTAEPGTVTTDELF
jgi:PD-(D/E)XK nuclease superfamily